jgi:hypothetical protein
MSETDAVAPGMRSHPTRIGDINGVVAAVNGVGPRDGRGCGNDETEGEEQSFLHMVR